MGRAARLTAILIAASFAAHAVAGCTVEGMVPNRDALANLLRAPEPCPANVFELRPRLREGGVALETYMVANRGFHNPKGGSFSLFERAELPEGELYFGHFTAPGADGLLVPDQSPRRGALMIELIAWDPVAHGFRFYELIGTGSAGQWFYRGSSADIREDVARLHEVRPPEENPFGARLRCSGCHLAGGPILKELEPPHDSWWTEARKLPLGGRRPGPKLSSMMAGLRDPGGLAAAVRASMIRLEQGPKSPRRQENLRRRLRPLFAPEELNLASSAGGIGPDAPPGATVAAPSSLFLDPHFGESELRVLRPMYEAALLDLGMRFPETEPPRPDADHAWLGPVKADADRRAIQELVAEGLIDDEFVHDVLAVDMSRPVFSEVRTGLLRLVPQNGTKDWQMRFRQALADSALPGASELLRNLTDPRFSRKHHRVRARVFLRRCAEGLRTDLGLRSSLRLLARRREQASESEISQNPRGQILEPGFRVVFPTPVRPGAELPGCPCGAEAVP